MADDQTEDSTLPAGARRDSGYFLLIFVVTLVLYLLSLPLLFGVIVTGPLAVFFAVRALYRSRAVKGVTGYRVGISGGAVVSFLAMLTGFAMIPFYGPVSGLQECSARAITQTAVDKCEREYQEGVTEVLENAFERAGFTP